MRITISRTILVLAALATLAVAGTAFAGGAAGFSAKFEDMDKNSDNTVDQDEFVTHFKDNNNAAGAFTIIDRDKSGGLNQEEWDGFMKVHGGGQHMKPGSGMGGMPPHGMMKAPHGKMPPHQGQAPQGNGTE
ncbi:calcium-binding protein [Oceanidesulfovibrio marinus]|uniref:Calcium-binding protein n=1 Tax=Oceanidesulfovibrio marinus TaxID=370038 RepID=A0A6P1ZFR4_9BACT|nr:calcium-binding protein [Oceanidesulfovibrio marinus]QJT09250.1 calcium-binding protein [Oceanidesulfovibrio marinus]TVM32745.1 calcium-binding protein [Oceanidesulfovibrio marinus]